MRIVLIGFAATGKTTIGTLLARRLNMRFVDTDAEVERLAGRNIPEIFDDGEEAFRRYENEVLGALRMDNAVIACGGGSVLCPNFDRFVRDATVVWLRASTATIRSRLGSGRPLFDGLTERQLEQAVAHREALYRSYADFTVNTDGEAERVVEKIASSLEG